MKSLSRKEGSVVDSKELIGMPRKQSRKDWKSGFLLQNHIASRVRLYAWVSHKYGFERGGSQLP
jgi:hypothetical protein